MPTPLGWRLRPGGCGPNQSSAGFERVPLVGYIADTVRMIFAQCGKNDGGGSNMS
jgi:hypothetical protein